MRNISMSLKEYEDDKNTEYRKGFKKAFLMLSEFLVKTDLPNADIYTEAINDFCHEHELEGYFKDFCVLKRSLKG